MKNICIAVVGFSLLFTTAHSSDGSMTWSPIPGPSLHTSPTLLTPETIAAAGLPATQAAAETLPNIDHTSTTSDYSIDHPAFKIVLKIDTALEIYVLIINGSMKDIIPFNPSGTIDWNTEHLKYIEAARNAHAY
jgi:hypothetical protein